MHAILPGFVDWQNFFVSMNSSEPLAFIGIRCHDLCRLLHFGSSVVKIIASYCLLELFNRISDQIDSKHEDLKCTFGYLMSLRNILEGLVFYNVPTVATNCALCLSILLRWENLGKETEQLGKSSWFRLIIEEMTVSLAAPAVALQSFTSSQTPAVLVAAALLKLNKIPQWMKSVLNTSCISGILENLTATDLSSEILVLFRQLLKSDFLSTEQIATINQILQVTSSFLSFFIFYFCKLHRKILPCVSNLNNSSTFIKSKKILPHIIKSIRSFILTKIIRSIDTDNW